MPWRMATKTKTKIRSAFGEMLRRDLDEAPPVSLKELARRLAGTEATAEQVNGKRRLLQKYLTGEVSPGDEMRVSIARALGKPDERYAEDAEAQQEMQQIADSLAPLVQTLYRLAVQARERGKTQ